jgi:hypothetical protein
MDSKKCLFEEPSHQQKTINLDVSFHGEEKPQQLQKFTAEKERKLFASADFFSHPSSFREKARSKLFYKFLCGVTAYRVARWFVYKPKIPFCVNFGGSCNKKIGIFYDHLVYLRPLETFWHILWSFGIFPPVLVCCSKKNLATLVATASCQGFGANLEAACKTCFKCN